MIAVFGRKDLGTGILHNRTNGGEGLSGMVHSEETKGKISEAHKGRTHSEESKRNMSEGLKGNINRLGTTHSEESKRKMSEANKNPSEETRKKMSEAKKGKTSNRKGVLLSEETRKKMSDARKGEKCWNNGQITKRCVECPGIGWVRGHLRNWTPPLD
jgi:hypothetical protein